MYMAFFHYPSQTHLTQFKALWPSSFQRSRKSPTGSKTSPKTNKKKKVHLSFSFCLTCLRRHRLYTNTLQRISPPTGISHVCISPWVFVHFCPLLSASAHCRLSRIPTCRWPGRTDQAKTQRATPRWLLQHSAGAGSPHHLRREKHTANTSSESVSMIRHCSYVTDHLLITRLTCLWVWLGKFVWQDEPYDMLQSIK